MDKKPSIAALVPQQFATGNFRSRLSIFSAVFPKDVALFFQCDNATLNAQMLARSAFADVASVVVDVAMSQLMSHLS